MRPEVARRGGREVDRRTVPVYAAVGCWVEVSVAGRAQLKWGGTGGVGRQRTGQTVPGLLASPNRPLG